MENYTKRAEGPVRHWVILVTLTVIAIYFYIFMEWLFFATKQSFMWSLGFFDKLRILWVTPAPFVILAAVTLFIILLPAILTRNRIVGTICLAVGLLMPAVTLALAFFLLIDNFTYTVFHFGVKTTLGYQGLVYGLLAIILTGFAYQFLHDCRKKIVGLNAGRRMGYFALGLFVISIVFAVAGYDSTDYASLAGDIDMGAIQSRPNVIILASDGLDAENMSAYGYSRETTPFIDQLSKNALFCENCFPNAGTSGGSIASMLTGTLPTQNRLIYPPDILKGADRYRHLPGLFKELGYRNFDISIKHYADPYDLNMLKSFDWANFREFRGMNSAVSGWLNTLTGQESGYFVFVMNDRITSRLLHSFSIRSMDDAYLEVTEGGQRRYVKYEKGVERYSPIVSLFSFVDESAEPFFAHLHLLKTHGPRFNIERPRFSKGMEETEDWMTDFYDDAILGFDGQVQEIVQGLVKRGLMDNTVIVICTDHGMGFTVDRRIPLIFVFPGGRHKGRIRANVQNLDIGPTLLEYIGIEPPDWMGGLSLLGDDIEARQFIFTVDRVHGKEIGDKARLQLDASAIGPPFYTLGSVGVFYCDRLFNMILEENSLEVSAIEGHTAPCEEEDLPDPESIRRLIIDHLMDNDYDVSLLELPISISSQ